MNPQKDETRSITGESVQRAVWLPKWAAEDYELVAQQLGLSVMEVTRTILLGGIILSPAGLRAEYFRVKELITREQAAHTGQHCEAVDEPVPPDRIETIGLKPKE